MDEQSIKEINSYWEDTEGTSTMWEIISDARIAEFVGILQDHPELAHIRSSDGRGPMWWAYEYKRPRMIDILKAMGVSDQLKDARGKRPGE